MGNGQVGVEMQQAIAERVRRSRTTHGWTLDETASRLGISRRLVAQLEAGTANPSLTTLLAVASGLGLLLADLVGVDDRPTIIVNNHADSTALWSTDNGSEARLLIGVGPLEMWHWTLAPGDEKDSDPHNEGARETLTVLAGEVHLTCGHQPPVTVAVGQSALIHADQTHTYANRSNKPAYFHLAVHEPSH